MTQVDSLKHCNIQKSKLYSCKQFVLSFLLMHFSRNNSWYQIYSDYLFFNAVPKKIKWMEWFFWNESGSCYY